MNMRTRVLSDADIRKIHATSLEVMEKLGIHIQDTGALKTFDIIARECEKSGFLDNPHTYKHFRQEHFIPSVSDRSMLASWQENGERDVRMRVREIIEEYLDAYRKPQLPDSLEQTLEDIIKSS